MTNYAEEIAIAHAIAPYRDDTFVGEVTAALAAEGQRILQIFRFSEDDAEHVAALAMLARFPVSAHVLDIGCGVGAVAEIMCALRPDLRFTLQNCSATQLALCPDFPKIHGDMAAIDAPDCTFDGVMVNYAMGHPRLQPFFHEAARILRRGGVFFAYDLAAPDTREFVEALGYVSYAPDDVIHAARAAGFAETESANLPQAGMCNYWRTARVATPEQASIAAKATPVAYRFIRVQVPARQMNEPRPL